MLKNVLTIMTDVFFEYNHILMRADYRTPDPHSHLAVHLILGVENNVCCDISDNHVEAAGIFIASDVVHTAYTTSGGMLVYLFDPACSYADSINENHLHGKQFTALSEKTVNEIRCIYNANASLSQTDHKILDFLGFTVSDVFHMDERIKNVLETLRSSDEVPDNIIQLLCSTACLSQSRLSHLFKKNVGISLHRYLAWEKMRKGYVNYQKYGNITKAAMYAGFDSPSHFSATCKRMFGLSFSDFIKGEKTAGN